MDNQQLLDLFGLFGDEKKVFPNLFGLFGNERRKGFFHNVGCAHTKTIYHSFVGQCLQNNKKPSMAFAIEKKGRDKVYH
jgi:hypothetical protein